MKYIEQKQAQAPPIAPSVNASNVNLGLSSSRNLAAQATTNSNNLSLLSSNKKSQAELSAYETDKKKYGALLPKTGVYFLPDSRIIAFLR